MNLLQKIVSAAGAADEGEAFPVRPIELVVPSSAGGGTDMAARLFTAAASRQLPQPIVVRNRPGAAGAAGGFAIGNAGTGSVWHLAAVAIEDQNEVRLHHVPFESAYFRKLLGVLDLQH